MGVEKKLSILLIVLLFLPICIYADMGPKPSVGFDVLYMGEKIPDSKFYAEMLGCFENDPYDDGMVNFNKCIYEHIDVPELNITEYDSAKDCYWCPAYLAWGGECRRSHCNFDYMPPKEFKLAVFIPSMNEVFISDEVSRVNFYSTYDVNLMAGGGITIEETTSFLRSDAGANLRYFIIALIITLILELAAAWIFLLCSKKIPKKILIFVLIANLISLPVVWFIFPLIKINMALMVLLAEIFAVVFESYFLFLTNKKIGLKKSFSLSIIMNLVSFLIGGFFVFLINYSY
jgi:hypothetical protein